MEGALKLKEISYIHAEAYPAGELKHGPLALVDNNMPVIAIAPNDKLLEKLESNLEEVRARGGKLYVFTDVTTGIQSTDNIQVTNLPYVDLRGRRKKNTTDLNHSTVTDFAKFPWLINISTFKDSHVIGE